MKQIVMTNHALCALQDCIFIPSNHTYIRINKPDILYLQAEGSSTQIVTKTKNFTVTLNIGNIMKQINDRKFSRISRKHWVNLMHIQKVSRKRLWIEEHALDITLSFREDLMKQLPLVKTKT